MTLRDFLNASYALLVEGYTSVAPNRIDLLSALEKVEERWKTEPDRPQTTRVEAQNDQALAQFNALMAGVQK